jgi:hypothetical protein
MKKQIYFLFLFLFGMLVNLSCDFNKGSKKDFNTGLAISYNGFRVGGAYLAGADNMEVSTNEVKMNNEISIVVEGIENYELKDGKAFPGLMLTVTDPQGNAVINEKDLLSGGSGYSPTDAAILRGTVTVGSPMKSGEKYQVRMHIWDKNKVENELDAEFELEVI